MCLRLAGVAARRRQRCATRDNGRGVLGPILQQVSPDVKLALDGLARWDFDVFHMADLCDGKPLTLMTLSMVKSIGECECRDKEKNLHGCVCDSEHRL